MSAETEAAPVLQPALPEGREQAAGLRLPGTRPLDMEDWLTRDTAFAGQMALRDRLIAERGAEVVAMTPDGEAPAAELLEFLLDHLRGVPGYVVSAERVTRPDGIEVPLDRSRPLAVAGRLVAEDLCLMVTPPGAGEPVLAAAVLCFPASWTLSQKIGRPLTDIHRPVHEYDAGLAKRVARLFTGLREGHPLVRHNLLDYAVPELHHPLPEFGAREAGRAYRRSERQCLIRLKRSRAVIFSIHTVMVRA